MPTLYYYHDPMCSWCWAYKPVADMLFARLPENIQLRYVVGGLAADSDEPMPLEMQKRIAGYWHRIQQLYNTEFNFAFWEKCQPRRSTYPACRAVLSAHEQGAQQQMIEAIQNAYYLRAMNPSDLSTLVALAEEIRLDVARFSRDIGSEHIENLLQKDIQFARSSPIRGFPSLVMQTEESLMPIVQDYTSYQATLDDIARICHGAR